MELITRENTHRRYRCLKYFKMFLTPGLNTMFIILVHLMKNISPSIAYIQTENTVCGGVYFDHTTLLIECRFDKTQCPGVIFSIFADCHNIPLWRLTSQTAKSLKKSYC